MNYSNTVVDTSLVVHSVSDGGHLGSVARGFFSTIHDEFLMISPPLFLAEVDSTLNLWRIREGKTRTQLRIAREIMDAMGIQIIHLLETHFVAREIADNLRLPRVYDATFAALAKIEKVDYYTADKTFYNAAHRKYPFVKLIA